MNLTAEQVAQFDDLGYVFVPGLFSQAEVDVLMAEVPALFAQDRPENVREKRGGVVRTNFAAHTYNDVYRRLSRHPRLMGPAMQLLGGPVYVHQFKINGKAAFFAPLIGSVPSSMPPLETRILSITLGFMAGA